MKQLTITLLIFILSCSAAIAIEKGTTVQICADQIDWPPFQYRKRDANENSESIIGYNIDVLDKIFAKHGIEYKISMIPWNRCLTNVKSGNYHSMTLPVSLNADRLASMIIAKSSYAVTPSYFYLKASFPSGINVKTADQLLPYGNICGRLGYNYTNFGFEGKNIIKQSKSHTSAFRILRLGLCDIFLARYEVVAGYSHIEEGPLLDDDIGHKPIPGVPQEKFHFMLSKHHKDSPELLKIINRGLEELEAKGELKRILKKYLQKNSK